MKTRTRISLLKWYIRDHVIFKNRRPVAAALVLLYHLLRLVGMRRRAWHTLLFSNRLLSLECSRELIKHNLDELVRYSRAVIMDAETDDPVRWIKSRCTILCAPDGSRKGVLIIKFSNTFIDVLKHVDCHALLDDYWVVLEPSWAGYALPEILAWIDYGHKIIIQASDPDDRELIDSLQSNLVSVPFGSSDWVDHSVFYQDEPAEGKTYDSIYVANFNSIKRQYVYLYAVREVADRLPGYRAALVCGEWGDAKEEVLDLIHSLGLDDVVDFFEELTQAELNVLLNRSKVNLLLSLKEGSNRSLFEGMFAGVPGIVLGNNVGVNKDYFTGRNGVVIDEAELADSLAFFSEHWGDFDARAWAMENIAPEVTTRKLEEKLRQVTAQEYSLPVKVNRPEATVRDESKRIAIDDAFLHKYYKG